MRLNIRTFKQAQKKKKKCIIKSQHSTQQVLHAITQQYPHEGKSLSVWFLIHQSHSNASGITQHQQQQKNLLTNNNNFCFSYFCYHSITKSSSLRSGNPEKDRRSNLRV